MRLHLLRSFIRPVYFDPFGSQQPCVCYRVPVLSHELGAVGAGGGTSLGQGCRKASPHPVPSGNREGDRPLPARPGPTLRLVPGSESFSLDQPEGPRPGDQPAFSQRCCTTRHQSPAREGTGPLVLCSDLVPSWGSPPPGRWSFKIQNRKG